MYSGLFGIITCEFVVKEEDVFRKVVKGEDVLVELVEVGCRFLILSHIVSITS